MMNTKIKFWMPAFGLCILLGLLTSSEAQDGLSEARKSLSQAVKEAKNGNRRKLTLIIDEIEERPGLFVSEELLAVYVPFLKDEDGQVQHLGAMGLYAVKSPKSTESLIEYLKSKDSTKLKEKLENRELVNNQEQYQYICEMQAFITAILALGEIGDSRVVSLLAEMQQTVDLELEWGFGPVQAALARLGAVKELADVPSGAEQELIYRKARHLKTVKDPNKVSDLALIVKDPNKPVVIRNAALSALANINLPGICAFFLDIFNDPNYPKDVRKDAAIAAGKTKDPAVEEPLLAYAQNPESDIRAQAFIGLVICMPEKYLDRWFEVIMNPSENREFRQALASMHSSIPGELLWSRREELYDCLNAAEQDGRPIDEIRGLMWCLINSLYGEEPSLVLTSRDSQAARSIRHVLERRLMIENHSIGYEERKKKVEEEVQRIVSVYDGKPNEGKEE